MRSTVVDIAPPRLAAHLRVSMVHSPLFGDFAASATAIHLNERPGFGADHRRTNAFIRRHRTVQRCTHIGTQVVCVATPSCALCAREGCAISR